MITGETNLKTLLQSMKPELNEDEYVFCCLAKETQIVPTDVIGSFKEKEGTTIILSKQKADELGLNYSFVSSWITLNVHSSLEAVGLTAAFSKALTDQDISCNVIAGFYHDHVFVAVKDKERAINALIRLSADSGT